jgi:hypothetical protein
VEARLSPRAARRFVHNRRMKHVIAAVLMWAALGLGTAAAQAPAPSAASTKTTWYFYTVKWGYQGEFLNLFQKNHYPILKAQLDAGVFVSVKTFVPENHGDGRADWTFAVELVEAAKPPAFDQDAVVKKLYPDQAKFQKEEQRRFELLVAHWDVPLNVVDMATRKPSM